MAQQQEPGLGLRQLRDGIQERAGLVDALSHSLLFAKAAPPIGVPSNVEQVVGLIAISGGKTPRSMAESGPPHGISSLLARLMWSPTWRAAAARRAKLAATAL